MAVCGKHDGSVSTKSLQQLSVLLHYYQTDQTNAACLTFETCS